MRTCAIIHPLHVELETAQRKDILLRQKAKFEESFKDFG